MDADDALTLANRVLNRCLDIAERQLAGAPFLCGGDLILADVQYGQLLCRYFDLDIERPERRRLRAYYESLVARPAYRKQVMTLYGELRAGAA